MTETNKKQSTTAFYAEATELVLTEMQTSSDGLSNNEAKKRLAAYGKNELAEGKEKESIDEICGTVQGFYDSGFTCCCNHLSNCIS